MATRFRKILIANRGEIALRILRTCRDMAISTVAVYTDDDRDAPHVRLADEACAIGPSYLDAARIVAAAQSIAADAIHPGYGFLSENARFAEACIGAGLAFIGPAPDAIRSMGLKAQAKQIAASCGIPVVPPGSTEFPVLIKASAGGGGRGMRLVRDQSELDTALESARSEAERSFGDGALILERYIENARHVEVQIFGDHHGKVIHLFERDCTIQRRFQKVIEESPCTTIDAELRERLCHAAVRLGRAIKYTNAGTIEFLVAPTGEFYFMEANTRIQVEHPVTEIVTGLDLIRMQIEVAQGQSLDVTPQSRGHAIEARLYAEDPSNQFLPSTGTVHAWCAPREIRVDTALEAGQPVSVRYDPLLAKLIAHGPDRETARRKLVQALQATFVAGVQTNRDYLIDLLTPEHPPERLPDIWFEAAGALYLEQAFPRPLSGVPANYRNNPFRTPAIQFESGTVELSRDRAGAVSVNGTPIAVPACSKSEISIVMDGLLRTFKIARAGDEIWVHCAHGQRTLRRLPRFPPRRSAGSRTAANSPMPGQVLRILVQAGQVVQAGDALVVLEAMKMEQTIRTTINGVVQSILVEHGQVVAPGQKLIEIQPEEQSV